MATMPSHHQNWERPTPVRLAAGASSDQDTSPTEINVSCGAPS